MKRYNGHHRVEAGFYWTPARWEIITIPGKGSGVIFAIFNHRDYFINHVAGVRARVRLLCRA